MAVAALERVGLGTQLKKKPNQMSGGQMQRVAIARAIVNNPEIILADEPTGALDTKTSEQVMDLLQEIADDRLVIMVTHNPELAQRYSTRIIELMDGEVVGDSNPYDGMPTILEPVSAMTDDGVTPIEEYIAEENAREEHEAGKLAEATATTEDAEMPDPEHIVSSSEETEESAAGSVTDEAAEDTSGPDDSAEDLSGSSPDGSSDISAEETFSCCPPDGWYATSGSRSP